MIVKALLWFFEIEAYVKSLDFDAIEEEIERLALLDLAVPSADFPAPLL